MKLTLKDLVKLIAPYLVAIGGAIGVYADGKSRFELMEYRVQVVEKDKDDLRNDLKSIKDVLYRIDTRLSVFGACSYEEDDALASLNSKLFDFEWTAGE